jgi:ketosteroid isomerase-like protein
MMYGMTDCPTAVMSATSAPRDMNDLADRFAKAFEEGDVATINSIYAPDAVVWHNTDEREQPREENIALANAVPTMFSSFKYRDVRVRVFDGGYVQQHVLHAVQKDGSLLRIPVCAVVQVTNNQITRIDEYYDSAREPASIKQMLGKE